MFKTHIKLMVLRELAEGERSGYDLMKEIGSVAKKPSPGYIYPLLRELEEKGFIRAREEGRKRCYRLQARGRRLLSDLQKSREDMQRRWRALADENDMPSGDAESGLHEAFRRFHRAAFAAAQKKGRRAAVRKVIEDAAERLEKL